MRLQVPPRHQAAVRALAAVTPDDFEELHEQLARQPVSITPETYIALGGAALGEKLEDPEVAIEALLSIDVARRYLELSPAQAAEAVTSQAGGLELADEEALVLQARLQQLLELDRVRLAARTLEVLSSHDRTYTSARVLTDLRPVFADDDVIGPPVTSAVVHTLRLDFVDRSGPRSTYVSMSGADLKDLLAVIERALRKGSEIRSAAEGGSLIVMDVGEEQ